MQYQEDISIDCEFRWVVDRNLSRTETRAVRDLENLYSIIIDYYLKKLENRYNRGYILPKKYIQVEYVESNHFSISPPIITIMIFK